MLKEAIEDLEWAASADGKQQGTAKVHLKRSPPQIALSANEMANLTIKLPVSSLSVLDAQVHAGTTELYCRAAGL